MLRNNNYDYFLCKTYFISLLRAILYQDSEFEEKASCWWKADDQCHRDMTRKIKPSDIYEDGAVVFLQSWPVPWAKMAQFSFLCEVLKMPYVGCNILSSSLAMDKLRPSESSLNQYCSSTYAGWCRGSRAKRIEDHPSRSLPKPSG